MCEKLFSTDRFVVKLINLWSFPISCHIEGPTDYTLPQNVKKLCWCTPGHEAQVRCSPQTPIQGEICCSLLHAGAKLFQTISGLYSIWLTMLQVWLALLAVFKFISLILFASERPRPKIAASQATRQAWPNRGAIQSVMMRIDFGDCGSRVLTPATSTGIYRNSFIHYL